MDAAAPGAERGGPGGDRCGARTSRKATRPRPAPRWTRPRASTRSRTASSTMTATSCLRRAAQATLQVHWPPADLRPAISRAGRRWCRWSSRTQHPIVLRTDLRQGHRDRDDRGRRRARARRARTRTRSSRSTRQLRGGQDPRQRGGDDRAGRRTRTPGSRLQRRLRPRELVMRSRRLRRRVQQRQRARSSRRAMRRTKVSRRTMIYIHGTCEANGGTITSPVTEGAPQIGDPLAGLIGPRQEDYPAGHCPKKQGSQIVYVADASDHGDGCQSIHRPTRRSRSPQACTTAVGSSRATTSTVKLMPGIYIIAGGGIRRGSVRHPSTSVGAGSDSGPGPRAHLQHGQHDGSGLCRCPRYARLRPGMRSRSQLGQCEPQDVGARLRAVEGTPDLAGRRRRATRRAGIELTGQGELNLAGTIYAPKAPRQDRRATATRSDRGARRPDHLVDWDIGGTGNLYMPYDPSKLYQHHAARAGPLGAGGSSGPSFASRRASGDRLARDPWPGGRAGRRIAGPTRRATS